MTATSTMPTQRTGPSPSPRTRTRSRRRGKRTWRLHLVLIAAAILTAFPFYAMVALSLQPGEAIDLPGSLFPDAPSFGAYADAMGSRSIPTWALNSTIYSVVSVFLVLLFASMSGYAFAKKRFFGRELIFWVFVAMLMLPYHLTIIPQYLVVSQLDGLNTMWGMILPTIANAQAMFLMRQFIQDIPDELIDAARIDGAGEFRIYWQIVLPQTKPILATLGTFVFLWHWNDFLWPLVSQQSPGNYVLTVGLSSMQEQEAPLATIMAGAVITFIPALLVFVVLQRYFVRGVMMSGIK